MNGEMVRTRQNPVEEKAREVDFSGFFRDAYVAANGKLPAGLHEGRSNPGMRGRTDPDASQHTRTVPTYGRCRPEDRGLTHAPE